MKPTLLLSLLATVAITNSFSLISRRLRHPKTVARASRRDFLSLAGLATTVVTPSLTLALGEQSVFVGTYTDPNHPGGTRTVELLDTKIGEFQLARVTGGGGRGEPTSFTLPAMVQLPDKKITIDFSPKGGPKDFSGTWDGNGIRFPDGNKWPKTTQTP